MSTRRMVQRRGSWAVAVVLAVASAAVADQPLTLIWSIDDGALNITSPLGQYAGGGVCTFTGQTTDRVTGLTLALTFLR